MNKPLKVLVIDDDKDLADSIAELLELRGYQTKIAYNGEAGVEMFRNGDFDVALIDVRMPGKTGVECLVEISQFNPNAQILMMTAFKDENVLRQINDSSALGIFNKPLDTTDLLETLRSISSSGVLLLVDDDPDSSDSLETFLTDRGYTVLVARTGVGALDIAAANGVDILLLDLRLPDIHGADVFFSLRHKGLEVPTIVITGFAEEEAKTISNMESEGGFKCFTKPFDPGALGTAVDAIMQNAR